MLCQSVSRVPPPPSGSSSQRMSCPPQLNSSTLGASARFTRVSDDCSVGAPTVESFAVPTVPRFRSESNGAHSRRCSGSVSAFHTCGRRVGEVADENERPLLSIFSNLSARSGTRRVLLTAAHVFSFLSQRAPSPSCPSVAPGHRRASTRSAGRERAMRRAP